MELISNDPNNALTSPDLSNSESSNRTQSNPIATVEDIPPGVSSLYGASYNFINSIIGAGLIGIPYALKQCGFFTGILMLLTVAILVDRSVIMLIEIGIKEQKYNFEDLALHLLGVHGYYVTLLFMFIFAYGAQIAYMVIIGDTIPIFLENTLGYSVNREIVMAAFATIIILPLCLLKNLSSLSKTSFVSILSDIFIVILVVVNSFSKAQKQDVSQNLNGVVYININIFAGIGTMAFAFVCQHNSFLVYKSLKEPNIENWKFVAHFSITISFLISLTLGIFGYLAFKDKTNGDILTNFSSENSLINSARLLLALCMTFVFPMECYVSRHCLLSLASNISTKSPTNIFSSLTKSPLHENQDDPNAVLYISSSNDYNQSERETDDSNQATHFITDSLKRNLFAFFLWLSSVSIAISDKNLGDVLSFTGINFDKFYLQYFCNTFISTKVP